MFRLAQNRASERIRALSRRPAWTSNYPFSDLVNEIN